MKYLNLKNFRLLLIIYILTAACFLFSAVYFIVTNSDVNLYIPEGQAQISFENNEFETINFNLTGDSLWSLDSLQFYTGTKSIKSGDITHNQISSISLELNIMSNGYMGFNYKVESEYSTSGNEFYDGLKFYINGELVDQFQPSENGNSSWQSYLHFINAGNSTFSLSLVKD